MLVSIEAWAGGAAPRATLTADDWFAAHESLRQEARAAYYEKRYSWEQIYRWLQAEHGYPLKDTKTVSRACR